ncbi:MAG: CoA transferase [Burkholderiales bacterium]|nr:MAG: CoA transferase [Burkholderiales bacterium]
MTKSTAPGSPLAGLTVVELGQVLAGPFAGAIFADLGAEVIKIERPEVGDDARQMGPPFRDGDSLAFQVFNRGKQSVVIDLKTPQGLAALDAIVAGADILVHNLRPGVPESLGLDGTTLCARHPRLIYCGMSAFGHVGPLAQRPGYEPLLQAWSGLSSINGEPDGPPIRSGASICDQGTGMWIVIGALSLLHRRTLTGRGGIVQGSLAETALAWIAQKSDAFANEGKLPERHPSGHPSFVPYEAFDGADGPFLLCVGNDRLFVKFAQVLGRTDWPADPRFRSNRDRLAHKAELLAQIRAVLATRPRAEWMAALEAAGVPCAPIHSVPEALSQPQVAALGIVQPVPGTDFALTGLPLSFDGERPAIRGPAPRLGADTARHVPD